MLAYQAKLTCDNASGDGCQEIITSEIITPDPLLSAFEAATAVIREAKARGWQFTKQHALCPDCAKAIKK